MDTTQPPAREERAGAPCPDTPTPPAPPPTAPPHCRAATTARQTGNPPPPPERPAAPTAPPRPAAPTAPPRPATGGGPSVGGGELGVSAACPLHPLRPSFSEVPVPTTTSHLRLLTPRGERGDPLSGSTVPGRRPGQTHRQRHVMKQVCRPQLCTRIRDLSWPECRGRSEQPPNSRFYVSEADVRRG